MNKKAIIIGAGPAGLTAAYELLTRTDIIPVILEKSGDIGGISKTINYKGNRMDIGGHRFFSKSDRVMQWWLNILPMQEDSSSSFTIRYQNKSRLVEPQNNKSFTDPNKVMLVRKRLSRIYFLRRFFTYPITLSFETLRKLGIGRTTAILCSYVYAQLFPIRQEKSLEDFMINRFGSTLYKLFFKDYTEKVWGVPCNKISAEWGAQRIKGVSIRKAIQHAISEISKRKKKLPNDISQKDTETSLIEQFLYPKYGPGQLWEEVARQIQEMGGIIHMHHEVTQIHAYGNGITAIFCSQKNTGEVAVYSGDYFFSTMPVKELIAGFQADIPQQVKEVAAGLLYRDFITVGILLQRLSYQDKRTGKWKPMELQDTWIYIQEKEVTVGRLQVFNNWSPYMVKDPNTVWVGMEFFCNETDAFWKLSDEEISSLAVKELEKIGLANCINVLDSTVLRVEKTYPAYFGSYEHFDQVREFTDQYKNLFLVGRNGMHKYNNADHSMLTAMTAVDNIVAGIQTKDNIWSINTEQEYHEEKKEDKVNTDNTDEVLHTDYEEQDENLKGKKTPHPLVQFVNTKTGRKWLIVATIGILVFFSVFKYLYPRADFSNDSYTYIAVAASNDIASIRPVGYSKFLRVISVFSTSDVVTTAVQYLLIEAGALYFFFSILYWIRPRKIFSVILFAFLLFNPAALYMANYISSDGIFAGLSLIWLTHLFWIINRPGKYDLVITSVLLFCILGIRYNALYYPFISIIAFVISREKVSFKIGGTIASLLVTFGLITIVTNANADKLHVKSYSPFGGWQVANNALQMYSYQAGRKTSMPNAETSKIESFARTYFDTISQKEKHPPLVLTDYMWNDNAPLRQYWYSYIREHHLKDSMEAWYAVSPILEKYGTTLIKSHPVSYASHFVLPNVREFFYPSLEVFRYYNIGMDSVKSAAMLWFNYDSPKMVTKVKKQQYILNPVRAINFGSNALFFLLIPVFLTKSKFWQTYQPGVLILILSIVFLLCNFIFSITAAPVVLRYQYLPILVTFSVTIILIDIIGNKLFHRKK